MDRTTYNLTTTDELKARRAMMADNMFSVVHDMLSHLRSEWKYNSNLDPKCADYAEELQQKFYDMLSDHSINMEELYP